MLKVEYLICISCPKGCPLHAERMTDNSWNISGNGCPRGVAYAQQELTDPRRVVTAVVRTDDPDGTMLPVRTDQPLPKKWIAPLLNRLYRMTVTLPVKGGDVLLSDVEGSGINVVASENRNRSEKGVEK